MLKRYPSNPASAQEAFRTALNIAKKQGARSWGQRAALSVAKLCQLINRPVEAHDVLARALEGFSPTPEMPEIAEAQALLESSRTAARMWGANKHRYGLAFVLF